MYVSTQGRTLDGRWRSETSIDTPVLSDVYTHLSPTEIRVVEIQPGAFHDPIEIIIKVVNLDDRPVYDALSYVWHPEDDTIDTSKSPNFAHVIGCAIFLIPVGANLEAAIRHLRLRDNSSTLWIDALCINQNNPMERNHQVGLMKTIYSSADHVFIWLGPALGESDFCVQVLQRRPLITERDVARFIIALATLFLRNWFTRVWYVAVAQELTLARKDPIVYVGNDSVPWSRIAFAVRKILHCHLGELADEKTESLSFHGLHKPSIYMQMQLGYWLQAHIALSETVQDLVNMRRDGPSATFGQQFFRTINLRCSDPRDKVFGLLGVSNFTKEERTITVDYNKSVSQVSTETTVAVLKSDFASYIKYQPWKHAEPPNKWNIAAVSPSWTINLRFITDARKADPFTLLYEKDLIEALARTHRIAPIIEFSEEPSVIHIGGHLMGQVVAIDDPIPRSSMHFGNLPLYLANFTRVSRSMETPISAEKIMSGLIGPYNTPGLDYEASLSELQKLMLKSQVGFGPFTAAMKERYSSTGVAFLTEEGHTGVYYRTFDEEENVNGTLFAAALFGIRIPFILKNVGWNRYKLWALAHICDHKLGDEDVEAMGPDDDWRDLVKQGKMEEFVIV